MGVHLLDDEFSTGWQAGGVVRIPCGGLLDVLAWHLCVRARKYACRLLHAAKSEVKASRVDMHASAMQ